MADDYTGRTFAQIREQLLARDAQIERVKRAIREHEKQIGDHRQEIDRHQREIARLRAVLRSA